MDYCPYFPSKSPSYHIVIRVLYSTQLNLPHSRTILNSRIPRPPLGRSCLGKNCEWISTIRCARCGVNDPSNPRRSSRQHLVVASESSSRSVAFRWSHSRNNNSKTSTSTATTLTPTTVKVKLNNTVPPKPIRQRDEAKGIVRQQLLSHRFPLRTLTHIHLCTTITSSWTEFRALAGIRYATVEEKQRALLSHPSSELNQYSSRTSGRQSEGAVNTDNNTWEQLLQRWINVVGFVWQNGFMIEFVRPLCNLSHVQC